MESLFKEGLVKHVRKEKKVKSKGREGRLNVKERKEG